MLIRSFIYILLNILSIAMIDDFMEKRADLQQYCNHTAFSFKHSDPVPMRQDLLAQIRENVPISGVLRDSK